MKADYQAEPFAVYNRLLLAHLNLNFSFPRFDYIATTLHLQCFYLRKFNSEILEHSQTESKYRRQHVLWVNLFKSSNTFYQKYLKYKHKYPITIFSFIFEMTLQSRSLKVKI